MLSHRLKSIIILFTYHDAILMPKGKEIINYYINELISEGRTYFPPFQGSQGRPRTISHADKKSSQENTDAIVSLKGALFFFSSDKFVVYTFDQWPKSCRVAEISILKEFTGRKIRLLGYHFSFYEI